MSGNSLTPLTSPIQSAAFTDDTTRPKLLSFTLNINTGILDLQFSEAVDVTTFNATGITLQNLPNTTHPTLSNTLTTTSLTNSPSGSAIAVKLSAADLNDLKSQIQLATVTNNTFMTMESFTVDDMRGNRVDPIVIPFAQRASDHVADTTRPSLTQFDLDLDDGLLQLIFSEIIDVSSSALRLITLQSSSSSSNESYSLTASIVPSKDANKLDISLAGDDLNALKMNLKLATTRNTTYVSLTKGAVADMKGNVVKEIFSSAALRVEQFTADKTAPELANFTLDLHTNRMLLTFTEVVSLTSLNLSDITFLSAAAAENTSIIRFKLTGGQAKIENYTVVILTLQNDDVNSLNAQPFCTGLTNCFLAISNTSLTDTAGNAVVKISTQHRFN
eukprot:m.284223 g.284223  ORF g.284223 m.284223 type:complete len:389 (+) comp40677_c0_seq9:23689-24855(+)